MDYFENIENNVKKFLNKNKISEQEYIAVFKYISGADIGNDERFEDTNLSLAIKALDKVDFKPSAQVFAMRWEKNILLDKNLVEFVKKYEEKILQPSSDITGDLKRHESISLILSSLCGLSPARMMSVLPCCELDMREAGLVKEQMLDFLIQINKGTQAQKLECLVSVDRVLKEYPEAHWGLSILVGFSEPVSFVDMVSHLISNEPTNNMDYIIEFKNMIKVYDLQKNLSLSLNNKVKKDLKKTKL